MAQYEGQYTGAQIDAAVAKANNAISKTINKTWSELKSLRDNSQLIPGQWYRITDYTCTTTQANTQSAGHAFDVIVRADEANKLNENAHAALHSGDAYFASSKLEAWQLQYCIDNDTTRFAWADTTNGKGVIYYMKDEWNNECPYDFKNIKFEVFSVASCSFDSNLVSKYVGIAHGGTILGSGKMTFTSDNKYLYTFTNSNAVTSSENPSDKSLTSFMNNTIMPNKLNVIPHVICCGSGNRISFSGGTLLEAFITAFVLGNDNILRGNIIVYNSSFNEIDGLSILLSGGSRNTLMGQEILCKGISNNIVKGNNNAIKVNGNNNNINCMNGTITITGNNNSAGDNNSNVTITGNKNRVMNNCTDVTITGDANEVGNNCSSLQISSNNNKFDSECIGIVITQSSSSYNTFGCNSSNITISGSNCLYNMFGCGCDEITISGSDCSYDTFGDSCTEITISGSNCLCNMFGCGCNDIKIPKNYTIKNTFGNLAGCFTFTTNKTTSSRNMLTFVIFADGFQGDSDSDTNIVTHPTLRAITSTTYKAADQEEVTITW